MIIKPCSAEHIEVYGKIYAAAFSGPPWYDPWKEEDAVIHVRELIESAQFYGLECEIDGQIAGFIMGTSSLFHSGRSFKFSDLCVDPAYQHMGIGTRLMEQCLADIRSQGMTDAHLITAREGALPSFYARFGFSRQDRVSLMGMDL